jgi:molybdopterin synthase sulfur carrier subunit
VAHVRLRLFAAARDAAGRANDELDAETLGDALAAACDAYGAQFANVLDSARVWVNGDEPPEKERAALRDGDEIAVVPPVSGGAR